MLKRALISVSDKTGIVEFARGLLALDFEIISTGGTYKALREAGVEATEVSEVTGFPEILGGRVKTLHPKIHGGLLAEPDNAEHREDLQEQKIVPISLVAVNLYPFAAVTCEKGVTEAEALENIDIGGPAMLRAAAKNYKQVTVVVDPRDYDSVLEQLKEGRIDRAARRRLAAKVFQHTAAYDCLIAQYLTEEAFPKKLTLTYELQQNLRYGENPHQKAAFYRRVPKVPASLPAAIQLQGKELSYNNINDVSAALAIVREFSKPAAVAVKHTNPCGVGVGVSLEEAFGKAFASDPVSIFGGVVAFNRQIDLAVAKRLHEIFLEIVLAPSFAPEALELLGNKKNLRLLTLPTGEAKAVDYQLTSLPGGLLIQEQDHYSLADAKLTVVTEREPTEEEWRALEFGWKVVKHVKSNAIVVSSAEMTLGVGAGQMNRVGAAAIALEQAGDLAKGAALASDAFFPMDDTVALAAQAGISAIIQPGGSIRDEDSIKKANEHNVAMVFTGVRHFKH